MLYSQEEDLKFRRVLYAVSEVRNATYLQIERTSRPIMQRRNDETRSRQGRGVVNGRRNR